jgi:hypothetical protein
MINYDRIQKFEWISILQINQTQRTFVGIKYSVPRVSNSLAAEELEPSDRLSPAGRSDSSSNSLSPTPMPGVLKVPLKELETMETVEWRT